MSKSFAKLAVIFLLAVVPVTLIVSAQGGEVDPPNATPELNYFETNMPTLTWGGVTWAERYQIEVDDDPLFTMPVRYTAETTQLEHQLTEPLENGTWYWHIRAINSAQQSIWSMTQSFHLWAPIPVTTAPLLLAPLNDSIVRSATPTLMWSAVEGATVYEIEYADNAGFTDSILIDNWASTSYTFSSLDDGIYYWRVRGKNTISEGPFSDGYRFGMDAVPQHLSYAVNSISDGADVDIFDGVCLTATPDECTLRAAIQQSNANNGNDTINFAIPGVGVQVIEPLSNLPTITDTLTIDGYSQAGSAPATESTLATLMIELSGRLIVPPPTVYGLRINGSNSIIKGLVINRFEEAEIDILSGGSGVQIIGNRLGTNPAGTVARGGGVGVRAANAPNLIVGGTTPDASNLISGGSSGIRVEGTLADGLIVQGNIIGLNAAGTAALPNGGDGIYIIGAPNALIGGTTPAARNIVSASAAGIAFGNGSGGVIQGNYVGTDITGTLDRGNAMMGIAIAGHSNAIIGGTEPGAGNLVSGNTHQGIAIYFNSSNVTVQGNLIGTDVTGGIALGNVLSGIQVNSATNVLIGGSTPTARNVIAATTNDYAIFVTHTMAASRVTIQGNYIGTNAAGTAALPNAGGIYLQHADENVIGGSGLGNLISGNLGDGIRVDSVSSDNRIEANWIGVDATGTTPLGNTGYGILVEAPDNIIGGTAVGTGNMIANSGSDGIRVAYSNAQPTRVTILGNRIFGSGGLGIELLGDGVTPNDPNDTDGGANNFQNFPVITAVTANTITVNLSTNGLDEPYRLEFFHSSACDPSGHGEGETLLGSVQINTDEFGDITGYTLNGLSLTPGYITTTATRMWEGDTSEFSACWQFAG